MKFSAYFRSQSERQSERRKEKHTTQINNRTERLSWLSSISKLKSCPPNVYVLTRIYSNLLPLSNLSYYSQHRGLFLHANNENLIRNFCFCFDLWLDSRDFYSYFSRFDSIQFQLLYNFAVLFFFYLLTSNSVSLAQYFFYCPCSMFLFHSLPSIWQLGVEKKKEKKTNDFQVIHDSIQFLYYNQIELYACILSTQKKNQNKQTHEWKCIEIFLFTLISLFILLDMYCCVFVFICVHCL